MHDKLEKLRSGLLEMGGVLVAFSGGVDSSLLLKVAVDALGERALGVTVDSPSLPAHERELAAQIAAQIGARHRFVAGREFEDERYLANPPDRCYFCKSGIGELLAGVAQAEGIDCIVDGNNADDTADFRPGQQAARERGIRSPLQEVGLSKVEIRTLAREMGLSNWDLPSAACLASRVPYGTRLSREVVLQIGEAERRLRAMGFGQLRVRHHGTVARIEVPLASFDAVLAKRTEIAEGLRACGYTYVTLDLAGFRSGSMNEVMTAHGR